MSIAEWREMPKFEDELPSDEADALSERLRDTAQYAQHTVGCGYIGIISGSVDGVTFETVDHKDTCTCGLWAILKRLKEEGLT